MNPSENDIPGDNMRQEEQTSTHIIPVSLHSHGGVKALS